MRLTSGRLPLLCVLCLAVAACGPSTSVPTSAPGSGSGAPPAAGPSGGILRSPEPIDPAYTFAPCEQLIGGAELAERLSVLLEGFVPSPSAGTDLTGVDLSRADLSCTDLSGVTLVGAELESARFDGALLAGVDLSGANLRNAELRGAELSDVSYAATVCPDGTNSDRAGGTCDGHLNPEPPIEP